MVSTLFSSMVLLAGHLSLTMADFTGQGYIHVLQSDSPTSADASENIGCMSASGALTLSNCGVFTHASGGGLYTSQGNCTFRDPTQPVNVDSAYGGGSYAWSCAKGVNTGSDFYYNLVSAPGQAVCAFLI